MNILKRLFGSRPKGMRLGHVLEQVYLRPMLITPEGFASIDKVIQSKLANESVENFRLSKDDDTDFWGEPLPVMEVVDKIAYIPVVGPVSYKVSGIARSCGVCDVGELKKSVRLAAEDDLIDGIVFDVSSPGGSVTHIPETAAYIAEVSKIKPTIAFTDDIMASGAYYLMAGCNHIFATPSADVGSIGTYMAILTYDKLYKEAGVDVNLFVGNKAPLKAMGFPGLPLSDTQREHLQQQVDSIDNEFKNFVRMNRPQIEEDAMFGQTLCGCEKKEKGLVDMLVGDIEDVIIR